MEVGKQSRNSLYEDGDFWGLWWPALDPELVLGGSVGTCHRNRLRGILNSPELLLLIQLPCVPEQGPAVVSHLHPQGKQASDPRAFSSLSPGQGGWQEQIARGKLSTMLTYEIFQDLSQT